MSLVDGSLVVVRGAGDLATGCIVRLVKSGFRVVALEAERPTAIRRAVSLCEAVWDGEAAVEGVRAFRCDAAPASWGRLDVPLLIDPDARAVAHLAPLALVDAILAKRNLGTRIGMAPVVVGVGPGFVAGGDVNAVVETSRGHDLGRVLLSGSAAPDTGVPGLIAGEGRARVLHAPVAGAVKALVALGDAVEAGAPVLAVRIQELFGLADVPRIARGRVADDPLLVTLANSHGRTPAQVTLRWELQHGIVTIPKSASIDRIASNFDVFDFALSDDDMAMIDALDRPDGRFGPHPSEMN